MKELHLAFIMDGNGRWALQQGLSRSKGHRRGIERVEEVIKLALKRPIGYLTFFCFSTENWQRPKKEVDYLMKALARFAKNNQADLIKNQVQVKILGDKERLSLITREALIDLEEKTDHCKRLKVRLAINYGGRQEIIEACRKLGVAIENGLLKADDINADIFSKQLANYPDPDIDLLIRTSGEQRISNFLLYQISYSELYFIPVYWPDFDEVQLDKAIEEFNRRQRRYGGLVSEA